MNLGAYYLVGIPAALLLGFVLHLNGKGLWSGLVAGTIVQSISLSLVTGFTNWEKQVHNYSTLTLVCYWLVIVSVLHGMI